MEVPLKSWKKKNIFKIFQGQKGEENIRKFNCYCYYYYERLFPHEPEYRLNNDQSRVGLSTAQRKESESWSKTGKGKRHWSSFQGKVILLSRKKLPF